MNNKTTGENMLKRIIKEWVLPTILVIILVAFGYKNAQAEDNDEYVPAPPRITPDAGPTVSALGIKDKEYLPVEVEEIQPLTFEEPETE